MSSSQQLQEENNLPPNLSTASSPTDNNDEEMTTPTMELESPTLSNHSSTLMPAPSEEIPYFPEKYPGKLCVFCNLGERSQLGQGEMLRLEVCNTSTDVNGDIDKNSSVSGNQSAKNLKNASTIPQQLANNKRQKGLNKCKNPVNTTEYVDEFDKIGHSEKFEFSVLVENNLYYYVHRSCAMWSFGIVRESNGTLSNVLQVAQQSLVRKCSFCNRFGASLVCKVKDFVFFCFSMD